MWYYVALSVELSLCFEFANLANAAGVHFTASLYFQIGYVLRKIF